MVLANGESPLLLQLSWQWDAAIFALVTVLPYPLGPSHSSCAATNRQARQIHGEIWKDFVYGNELVALGFVLFCKCHMYTLPINRTGG